MNTTTKFLLAVAAAGSLSLACKQRQDTASVKDDETDASAALDSLVATTWVDLDAAGAVTSPLDVAANVMTDAPAMALADTPATQQILTVVGQLQAQLDSGASMNRAAVQRLINDL